MGSTPCHTTSRVQGLLELLGRREPEEALENPSAAPVRARSSQLVQGTASTGDRLSRASPSVQSRKFMRHLRLGSYLQMPYSGRDPSKTPIKESTVYLRDCTLSRQSKKLQHTGDDNPSCH